MIFISMRALLFTISFLMSFISYSQNDIYNLPHKSVTKELLKNEQFNYYEDEYRVYLYFKPTLVDHFYINTLVHGRRIFTKGYRVSQFNNFFEYKKIGIKLILHVVVNGYTYVINVEKTHH